ncbi:MAG: VanW family protein [Brevefilum sp.]|jgi:vancomycin resistance protein YoaR
MMSEKQPSSTKNKLRTQILWSFPISLVIFGMLVVIALIAFEVVYAEKIYPGIYILDENLSGLSREEASQRLSSALPYTYEGKVSLAYEDRVWEARPIDLGYLIDPTFSAQHAYETGRRGWFPTSLVEKVKAWFTGIQLTPVVYYDERIAQAFIQSIAAEIDQPVQEASLALENTQVVVRNGQVGKEVDIEMTLALIETILMYMQEAEVPIVVHETSPQIMDVSDQAELTREILSEALVIQDPSDESQSWTISPEELAGMLSITRDDDAEGSNASYQISLNQQVFTNYLKQLASSVSIEPENTRFIFNDDTHQLEVIKPATIGRRLDIAASLEQIDAQVKKGSHEASLAFETIKPTVTDDMTAADLGVTELVHAETTYFYGSDAARVQNIEIAASQFHGLLIPPGETFSLADNFGNISLENGYAEALIIYGGQTIQGVGGGICQVSTTLFRAAFFAGFPIVERHAHAYRVSYYEMRSDGSRDVNLAGLDATVYVPIVDLKFTNDTDHWLLMETYMGDYSSLTWKFYSTGDGRTVSWQTTGPTNVVPAPEDLYRENPDLKQGEIKKVDYAAEGADITVTRTVYKGDAVHLSDTIFTRFRPWQAVFEYGPGTKIPESKGD